MPKGVATEIEKLRKMSVTELRVEWRRVFGTESRNRNKDFLFRRIAQQLQELAHGGLSDHARELLEERLRTEQIRIRRKLPDVHVSAHLRDPRLPAPGTVLVREFANVKHEVKIVEDGVEFRGQRFRTLSAVAREITGTRWNGFVFFRLAGTEERGAA